MQPSSVHELSRRWARTTAATFAMLLALLSVRANAQNRADYEQYLFPLAPRSGYDLPSPGGFRHLDFHFRAFNPAAIRIPYYPGSTACVVLCIGGPHIEPGVNSVLPGGSGPGIGQFLYLARPEGALVQFNVRLFNSEAPGWGTEIPVIRENQYFTGTVHLLNLPLDDRFPVTLRVYDPDAVAPQHFRVRIVQIRPEQRLLKEIDLTTTIFDRLRPIPSLPLYPAYAEIPNLRESVGAPVSTRQRATRPPPSVGLPDEAPVAVVRVEIEPTGPGTRFWAFATVSSTEADTLTLVTPQ